MDHTLAGVTQPTLVVIDFGQNLAGRLKITLSLPSPAQCRQRLTDAGSSHVTLVMRHSELLYPNGSLNTFTLGNHLPPPPHFTPFLL